MITPYFIVGTGRCGTTILGQILNNHTKICVPPELQIVKRFYDIFSECLNLEMIAEDYINDINNTHLPYDYDYNFSFEDFFKNQEYPQEDLKTLLSNIFREILENNKKEILIKQVPWYGLHLDIIKKLYPKTKIIHIIRDGRDVSLSFYRTKWWGQDFSTLLNKWCENILKIKNDALLFFGGENYLEIKYEHLILQPIKSLSEILGFLNLEFSRDIFEISNIPKFSEDKLPWINQISSEEFLKWNENRKSLFFIDNVFRWKKNNTVDFKNLSDFVKKTLIDFGYSLC